MISIKNEEGIRFLESVEDASIDLILTDPPYITSKDTGMNRWVEHVKKQDSVDSIDIKTEEGWNVWVEKNQDKLEGRKSKEVVAMKQNFIKYGSVYGKKYARVTDFGDWDKQFTLEKMNQFVSQFNRVLRPGGTAIIFFDLWKITPLKQLLEDAKFKQIRFVEWIKTNPQPLNSSVNYLTNAREIAVLGVKGAKPTFNSKYDNGLYHFPLQGGKYRIMPTQKSTKLYEAIIEKHSNIGDTILDPFLGAGTTVVAAHNTSRKVIGCEVREEMYQQMLERVRGELGAS